MLKKHQSIMIANVAKFLSFTKGSKLKIIIKFAYLRKTARTLIVKHKK